MDLTANPGYVPGFPDMLNLRELGGLASADGRTVRHGLLYRGSTLENLTDEQCALVDGLGLRFMLDLRAAGEAEGRPDYLPDGTEYLRIGGMYDSEGLEIDFSPAGIARMSHLIEAQQDNFIGSLYVSMMFDNPALRVLMERFTAGVVPMYFHCSAGKDRTGVCAALLLSLLGVPDDTIVQEFLLTNEYRSSLINNPPTQLPPWMVEGDLDRWRKANGVQEQNLRDALAVADERYGSREAYFEAEFGLDAVAIADLRDRYLE